MLHVTWKRSCKGHMQRACKGMRHRTPPSSSPLSLYCQSYLLPSLSTADTDTAERERVGRKAGRSSAVGSDVEGWASGRGGGGSTPTQCLDKPMLRQARACTRHNVSPGRKSHPNKQHGVAMCGTMFVNITHNQRHERAPLSLCKCVTNAQSCIQDNEKQRSQKILKTVVQRSLCAWTSPCFTGGSQQRAIRRLLPASVPLLGWGGGEGGAGAGSSGGVRGPARGGGGAPDPYIYGLKWPSHRVDHLEVQM